MTVCAVVDVFRQDLQDLQDLPDSTIFILFILLIMSNYSDRIYMIYRISFSSCLVFSELSLDLYRVAEVDQ
jgi:hypothetical protein